MHSIIITPKSKDEYRFIQELIAKMNLSYTILSDEEKEDFGMSLLMKKTDRSQKVSRETVMKRLRKK